MAPELAGKMTAKAAVAAAKPATKAFVTFLAGDGDYWMGVVGLAKGLRKAGSAYPLVVAVLPDVPESHRRILVSQGCIVREIVPVYPPENENQTQFAMAYYVINYSKLRIWEFVEYERMVYLDADIQVFYNIDELFDLPKGHLYAVMDKVTWPAAEMGFNAGMFVHEPSMATAKALLDTLRVSPTTPFAEQGARTNKSQDHRVAFVISYDRTPSDENEKKMEGRRSYVFTMAASSLAWAFALLPYWGYFCSDTSISKTWKDVLTIGYIFLIITVIAVSAQSSRFKDGKLPDGAGFKLLQIVQAVVLICLWAGTFIPLHVCRCMPNSVVWTCAAGGLFIIVISWAIVFQQKTVIKCIKALCQIVVKCAKALCEMVIKCTKVMYDRVQQWLPDPSLPECIKAMFKKMPQENSDPGVPMVSV